VTLAPLSAYDELAHVGIADVDGRAVA